MGGFHPSVLWYVGLSHLVSRGCGPTVCGDGFCPLSQYIDQTLSHVRHYYKIHGQCFDALLSPAVLRVPRGVRIECATLMEDRMHYGNCLSRGIWWYRLSSTTVLGGPWGISSLRWHFGVGLAACFGFPSTSTHQQSAVSSLYTGKAPSVPVQDSGGRGEVSEWRGATSFTDSLLQDSAKNDVYRTGRFHLRSAHRPVDRADICWELYDHAVFSTLHQYSARSSPIP